MAERRPTSCNGDELTASGLLPTLLTLAVPLRIDELRQFSDAEREALAQRSAAILADVGEAVLVAVTKRGETQRGFVALVNALACLAFVPGGCRAFGQHWDATQAIHIKLGEQHG